VEARVIDRQIERHLPAQIEANRLHRPLIGEPVTVGEQQHLRQQAGRNRRAAMALRIALREVLVADDPIPVLGEQRVDRALRQQVAAPRRVEQVPLPVRENASRSVRELAGEGMLPPTVTEELIALLLAPGPAPPARQTAA
jgi:hypothetical protein